MKFIFTFIVLLISLPSCGPVENSASLDKDIYGSGSNANASAEFANALKAMKKCKNCHGEWLSYTEAEFISLGLVVPDNPENSPVYFRNIGATSSNGPKNMPNAGLPPMSATELANMITWINSL